MADGGWVIFSSGFAGLLCLKSCKLLFPVLIGINSYITNGILAHNVKRLKWKGNYYNKILSKINIDFKNHIYTGIMIGIYGSLSKIERMFFSFIPLLILDIVYENKPTNLRVSVIQLVWINVSSHHYDYWPIHYYETEILLALTVCLWI
jgi:hypothetical protein